MFQNPEMSADSRPVKLTFGRVVAKLCSPCVAAGKAVPFYLPRSVTDQNRSIGVPGEAMKPFVDLESATCINDQMNCVMSIVQEISKKDCDSTLCTFYLNSLAHIFLLVDMKDALKAIIASKLCDLADDVHPHIVKSFQTALLERYTPPKGYIQEPLQSTVVAIYSCFEYFRSAELIFAENWLDTLKFLQYAFHEFCLSCSSKDLSPIEKNDIFKDCHLTIRTIILLLQRCKPKAESGFEVISATIQSDLLTLLREQSAPMELQANSGLALVILLHTLHKDNLWSLLFHAVCSDNTVHDIACMETVDCCICLAVCVGLLSGLPEMELRSVVGKTTVIEALFEQLKRLSRDLVNSSLTLGVSRGMYVWTQKVLNLMQDDAQDVVRNDVVSQCLECIWNWLEHYMDNVRHQGRKVLENLLQICLLLYPSEADLQNMLQSTILKDVLSMSAFRKSKYVAMTCVADVIGTNLIKMCPSLPLELCNAMDDCTMSTHVGETYCTLLKKQYSIVETNEWLEVWIKPLFKMLISSEYTGRTLEGILTDSMKMSPEVLPFLLSNGETEMKLVIIGLKIARKLGQIKDGGDSSALWKGVVKRELLVDALLNVDDNIRSSALSIVIDSRKTTQPYTVNDLSLLKDCLPHNLNGQSPAFRQMLMSVLKLFLNRVKQSGLALYRKSSTAPANDTSIIDHYNKFLIWLCSVQFDNLLPGSNFSSRGMAMQILLLVKDNFGFGLGVPFDLHSVCTAAHRQILTECFLDTYEAYKAHALVLLKSFPPSDKPRCVNLMKIAFKLASSPRPPESITAAYLFRMLLSCPAAHIVAMEFFHGMNIPHTGTIPRNARQALIFLLCNRLNVELENAKKNLLLAAADGPMYGALLCIRSLFKDISVGEIVSCKFWREITISLLKFCHDSVEAVSPVISNSSPEGHLPMDFDSDAAALMQRILKNSIGNKTNELNVDCSTVTEGASDKVRAVSAQMLLLCSWRTMKEVCLFLGEICSNFPVAHPSEFGEYLLTVSQVKEIGELFTTLTAKTKHRGAFEQAYVGFSQLCSMLWRSPIKELNELPREWLDDMLASIQGSGSKSHMVCATRRSAGVPYMIQALVSAEIDVQRTDSLNHTVKLLLKLVGQMDTEMTDQRVHAMNILRALFRDTRLTELLASYVPDGIVAALEGFRGKTWGERNSATLLYSALMTRVFGVKRTRDELSKKNRMTGRLFFQRYPTLYEVMMKVLIGATSTSENSVLQLQPDLYPVLMLLARLYPSPNEGIECMAELSGFIPHVQKCGESAVCKTRVLAAKAMVPLIVPDEHLVALDKAFCDLVDLRTQTAIHGKLLQIHYLVLEMNSQDTPRDVHAVDAWLAGTLGLLGISNRCALTCEVYANILENFALNPFWSLLPETADAICTSANKVLNARRGVIGDALCCAALTKTLITMDRFDKSLLQHPYYEVRHVALQALETGITNVPIDDVVDIIICGISGQEKNLECIELLFKIAAVHKNRAWAPLNTLIECCETHAVHDEICSAALIVAGQHVVRAVDTVSTAEMEKFAQLLLAMSTTERESQCRLAVCNVLLATWPFTMSSTTISATTICNLYTAVILLLQDDEVNVRNRMANIVREGLLPSKATELFVERFTEHVGNLSSVHCIVTLVRWALWDEDEIEFGISEDEERVFDRGEMNTYVDETLLSRVAVRSLTSYLNNSHAFLEISSDLAATVDTKARQVATFAGTLSEKLDRLLGTARHLSNDNVFLLRGYSKWLKTTTQLWQTLNVFRKVQMCKCVNVTKMVHMKSSSLTVFEHCINKE